MLTEGLNIATFYEFDDARRSASDETRCIFLAELADVDRVEAINILTWINSVEGLGFVDVGFGSGAWTRMPLTSESALSASIFSKSAPLLISSGRMWSWLPIPMRSAVFCFFFT